MNTQEYFPDIPPPFSTRILHSIPCSQNSSITDDLILSPTTSLEKLPVSHNIGTEEKASEILALQQGSATSKNQNTSLAKKQPDSHLYQIIAKTYFPGENLSFYLYKQNSDTFQPYTTIFLEKSSAYLFCYSFYSYSATLEENTNKISECSPIDSNFFSGCFILYVPIDISIQLQHTTPFPRILEGTFSLTTIMSF